MYCNFLLYFMKYVIIKALTNGEVKILTNAMMVANGASIYDVTDETHQDYVVMAERFAQDIGVGFVDRTADIIDK